LFVRPLSQTNILYMIGGSVAAIFYGEPRLTHDVDFVAVFGSRDIRKLPVIFPDSDFYLPPVEIITEEVARGTRGQFNVIHMDSVPRPGERVAAALDLKCPGERA